MRLLCALIIFFLSYSLSFGADLYPFSSKEKEARFWELANQVRCVVCQNQSLAESSAPLANDLRNKIYTLINQDKTDTEIKTYLVQRYSDFILLNPPISGKTILLWSFPILSLVIMMALFYFFNSKKEI